MKKNQKSLTGEAIVAGENNSEIINEQASTAQVINQVLEMANDEEAIVSRDTYSFADDIDEPHALPDLFFSFADD